MNEGNRFDGMLEADEAYFKEKGEPLYSSHMLDLSEESKEDNIATCEKYFKRMAKINLWLEMEIGITGGEEDGVNNEDVDNASLYTQPEDIVCLCCLLVCNSMPEPQINRSGTFTKHSRPSLRCSPSQLLLVMFTVFTVSCSCAKRMSYSLLTAL